MVKRPRLRQFRYGFLMTRMLQFSHVLFQTHCNCCVSTTVVHWFGGKISMKSFDLRSLCFAGSRSRILAVAAIGLLGIGSMPRAGAQQPEIAPNGKGMYTLDHPVNG